MTKRIKKIRDELCLITPEIFSERAEIITESYKKSQGKPYILRRAIACKDILEHISINIFSDELIVGSSSSSPRGCQVFPEYDMTFVINELDTFNERKADRFYISEENKAKLREIYPFWEGNSLADTALDIFSKEKNDCSNDLVFILTALRSGVGHIIIDYKELLHHGIVGILEKIDVAEKNLCTNDTEYTKKKLYYDAARICCNAITNYANRYAKLALELSKKEENSSRRKELYRISQICTRVPYHPARDFYEALQSFWFFHLVLHIESSGHSISPGRFDQYMFPFYSKDSNCGISKELLTELLQSLWVKFFELNKVRDAVSSIAFGGYPMFQNLLVGGQDSNGRSAVNELSYECLNATSELRLPQPSLSIRWFFGIQEKFLKKAFEVVSQGTGLPAMFNDEVLIPNMLQMGYSLKEARDYGIVGCTETTGQGNVEPWLTGGFINALKILELTIFNGKDPVTGTTHIFQTGEIEDLNTFEEFLGAYKLQMSFYLRELVECDNILDSLHAEICPNVVESLFISGCIEKGKTTQEGGAKYNSTTLEIVGLPNVADSLFVIKKLIYEDKTVSWGEMKTLMSNSFKSNPVLQQSIKNTFAKYGNDKVEVDSIGEEIVDYLYSNIQQYRSPRKGKYLIALYSIASHTLFAKKTGATPDGRSSFEVLADGGVSCSQGRDISGLTALLNSVITLDPMKALGSCLLNVRLSPELFKGDNLNKIIDTIKVFFLNKGQHIQFNVFDTKMMRDAQKHPEKYPTLMVRVAGFSVLFTTIDESLQNDIIARTEQCEGGLT